MKIFGHPKKILLDNGRESYNQSFHEFCENLNRTIKATAGKTKQNIKVSYFIAYLVLTYCFSVPIASIISIISSLFGGLGAKP